MARELEFTGKAGTIYVKWSDQNADDNPCEVWYEDFCIIGMGKSEREALEDAVRHVENISVLVSTAIVLARTQPAREVGR